MTTSSARARLVPDPSTALVPPPRRARLHLVPPAPAAPSTAAVRPADRTMLGVLAILLSTVSFPISDLASQSLMSHLPPLEVAWLRYVVFLLVSLPILLRRPTALRTSRPGLQVLRGAMAACSTLAAIVSFKFLAVPATTAIGFVAPVMVTALAVVVLKETVGIRRWSAALLALAGVIVIVQPGGDSFRLAALIPLAGATANAVTVICTRLNTSDETGTTVLYSTIVGTVMLTGLVVTDWHTPTLHDLSIALVVGLFGALGSLLQVQAYRFASASVLAPFTYTQLIWASGLSFLLLGSVPGLPMVAGAGLIGASAIYTAYRERVRGGPKGPARALSAPDVAAQLREELRHLPARAS